MNDTPKLIADELAKLVALKEAGHLSETEFAAAKSRLLGETPAGAPSPQLHSAPRVRRPTIEDAGPAPAPVRKKFSRSGIVIAVIICVVTVLILGNMMNRPRSPGPEALPDSPATTPSASPYETPLIGEQWSYTHVSDDMTSKQIGQASVTSGNSLYLDSPYDGAQNGTLSLRNHPRFGTDIIVRIEQGQILCRSYEDCTLLVRFDDAEPTAFSAIGPSDGSSDTVFIRNYARFLTAMKAAKKVRVSLPIYQNGNQTLEFDVSGFDAKRYAGN